MIKFLNTFRSWFLSPDSKLELRLRTLYHKFLATRIAFLVQDWLAKRSYLKWRRKYIKRPIKNSEEENNSPTVSFIVFCQVGLTSKVQTTIQSINNLEGTAKEIILFYPGEDHNLIDPGGFSDERFIQSVENQMDDVLKVVNNGYVIFCMAGDQFYDTLLGQFYRSLQNEPFVALAYYDCEYFDHATGQLMPHFKPGKFSPELLLSINYLSRGFIRTDAARQVVENWDMPKDFFAFEYALVLRISKGFSSIAHIPAVLTRQKNLVHPSSPELKDVVRFHLSGIGLMGVGCENCFDKPRFYWQTGKPSISMVILTKNHQQYLGNLLESIHLHTKGSNFEIIIVDNGSNDPVTLAFYEEIACEEKIKLVSYNKPFNYSEAINLGAQSSDSDLILFLNDDMLVRNAVWLEELTQWAIRPEIGVVGAKLLRRNLAIQHAGIIMGLNGFAGHLYLNASEHYHGLFGSVDWVRNVLAVTGACQMVRREVFEAVGGYDEGYQLAFGDIDFCLRVYKLGYRNVITPFASLLHFEGQSRGYKTPTSDILKGLEDMQQLLIEGDPYFSLHLTPTNIPKCDLSPSTKASRKKQIDSRTSFYLNHH